MKYVFLTLVFLVGCLTSSFAQKNYVKGYLVLSTGDTLHGMVKDRKEKFNSIKLLKKKKFKADNGKKYKFTASTVLAYSRLGDHYRSVSFRTFARPPVGWYTFTTSEQVFLKVVVDDHLSLYEREFEDEDYLSKNLFLIRPGEPYYTVVPLLNFRKRMKPYFSDAEMISKAIQQKEYRNKDLYRLVRDYNDWYHAQTQVKKDK